MILFAVNGQYAWSNSSRKLLREFLIHLFCEISMVTRAEGAGLLSYLAHDSKNMSRCQCCVWSCTNKKGQCPEDMAGNRSCGCPFSWKEGCSKPEYVTLYSINSMPELVKQAVIEKINHIRQGLQQTKWQPPKQGPSRVNNDILPIYYNRPSSYPAANSEPKKEKNLRKEATTKEFYQK